MALGAHTAWRRVCEHGKEGCARYLAEGRVGARGACRVLPPASLLPRSSVPSPGPDVPRSRWL